MSALMPEKADWPIAWFAAAACDEAEVGIVIVPGGGAREPAARTGGQG